jgi:hypothetical protein
MTKQGSRQLQSLCVFCGSSPGADGQHREAAVRLGRRLADEGITLVFGGGRVGLMDALAGAAQQAGGRVVGIIPEHLVQLEAPFQDTRELIVVDSMHTRKRRMFELADAFCVLPGGLGTLDETFEVLTWKQLGLHNKPVVLASIGGYWAPWLDLVAHVINGGFAPPSFNQLYSVVDHVDDVLPAARRQFSLVPFAESRLI